jgi:murein DD-endopeptidase MepM/ murein hydrolase activator NlpD
MAIRYRVQVKPSWSARVYGTYHLGLMHLALATLMVVQALALGGYLLYLNAASPDLSSLLRDQRAARALGRETLHTTHPALLRELASRTSDLSSQSGLLAKMLGVEAMLSDPPHLGRGSFQTTPQEADRTPTEELQPERLALEVSFLRNRFDHLRRELEGRAEELRYTPSIVPLAGDDFVPTSRFGYRRSPFTNTRELHRGQDLAADMHTPIHATAAGTVKAVNEDPRRNRMGRYVAIDHAGRYVTYYGHCSRVLVREGQPVERHQVIAEVGNSGRSTGPHVHYEVRRADGRPEDPRIYMAFHPKFVRSGDDLW